MEKAWWEGLAEELTATVVMMRVWIQHVSGGEKTEMWMRLMDIFRKLIPKEGCCISLK